MKAKPFYKRKRFYLAALLLGAFLFLHSCMQFRTSDKKTLEQFKKIQQKVAIDYIASNPSEGFVRVISAGTVKENAIIFIHGAPGSADAFYGYLSNPELLEKATLITYDRPGYGYSGFGKSLVSIEAQAKVVDQIIRYYALENVYLVGHSYGGPVAALTPLFNNKVKGVLLLAPAMAPEHEKYFWIGSFARWKLTRWMVPTSWKVSADEKYSHEQELYKLVGVWKEVSVPVVVLQGDKDTLVPFENLAYCEEHFSADFFKGVPLENQNHFIPWNRKVLVIEEVLKLITD